MSLRTIPATILAIVGALLVLAPAGAAAHSSHAHPAVPKHATASAALKGSANSAHVGAMRAEIRAQSPAVLDHQTDFDCGDRGCCSNGHCTACGNAIAPGSWAAFEMPAGARLLVCNSSPPSALAREGPKRPPKAFV
jgi:hypothetical protein